MSNIFFRVSFAYPYYDDGVTTGFGSRINGPRDSLASVGVSRQAQDRLTTLTQLVDDNERKERGRETNKRMNVLAHTRRLT